mmetsp:Transcript_3392/g.5716  ORF Transcript_3392/g.5716 Transcript_3392/m.5716 type:complete len:161 (+) Transcript_3392:675-1157(+)
MNNTNSPDHSVKINRTGRALSMDVSMIDNRVDPLAQVIGQLIRLYAKSSSLSKCFQNLGYINRLVDLMQHQQYNIQSEAHKTLEMVFHGPRIQDRSKMDPVIEWVDSVKDPEVKERINEVFTRMRQSEIYASKRLSMNLQYVVLSIGLRESMVFLEDQLK